MPGNSRPRWEPGVSLANRNMSAGQNYLKVVYNESRTPKTEYPRQLIEYLVNRFALRSDTLLEPGVDGTFCLSSSAGLTCFGLIASRSHSTASRDRSPGRDLAKDALRSTMVHWTSSIISRLEHLYDPSLLMTESTGAWPGGKLIILTPDSA